MTQETITQNNKLIAEFMGETIDGNRILCFEPHGPYREMQYHKSWDWLMPVVLKCQKKYKRCLGVGEYQYKIGELYRGIEASLLTCRIGDVYLSVAGFIEWRNQTLAKGIGADTK
jgi:hypothetical protein